MPVATGESVRPTGDGEGRPTLDDRSSAEKASDQRVPTSEERTEQEISQVEAREQPRDNAEAPERADSKTRVAGTTTVGIREHTRSDQFLTAEKLATMSAGEIRAVAHDRGYKDLGTGGQKSIARRFQVCQNDSKEELDRSGPQTQPVLVPSENAVLSGPELAKNAEGKTLDPRVPAAILEDEKRD